MRLRGARVFWAGWSCTGWSLKVEVSNGAISSTSVAVVLEVDGATVGSVSMLSMGYSPSMTFGSPSSMRLSFCWLSSSSSEEMMTSL